MKFLSWKGISIYLTIILFLLIFIQILDWNKGKDKEGQYAVELEKAYTDLVDFQTYILNDEVQIDENKHVLTMYEKNFQYQLSMFIDIFGNKKVGEENLFDSYKQIDEALAAFYEAESAEQQGQAHEQLLDAKQSLFTILHDLK
ncbi:iron ABC transporter substrate-binding protein [Solibacillus isronensis]|uniref:iron ABC transporter substrate-binding protein n=1 Tax=Solibacillus isronensis TaxID=412383 RepID=UPI0009A5B3F0|nr:iron ABC transporter substrate-binding protein [Solibacillus isronensis]